MQRKPIDVGNSIVCASFTADGRWLSVGRPDSEAGIVELAAASPFPAEYDGVGDQVRAYRERLTQSRSAMIYLDGLELEHSAGRFWSTVEAERSAEVAAWAVAGQPTVVQQYKIRDGAGGAVTLVFAGRLDTPAYAEITPVGPRPPQLPPSEVSVVNDSGHRLQVTVPGLATTATLSVIAAAAHVGRWAVSDEKATVDVEWAPDVEVDLRVVVTLDQPADEPTDDAAPAIPSTSAGRGTDVMAQIADGATRYTRECTALRVDRDRSCILTDHRLLPLSWTRDAYYQAALLLAGDDPSDHDVVRRHLLWLWGPGRDVVGVWQRSHLTTGAVKDPAYQADQQLYPLLELVDYRRVVGHWPETRTLEWGPRTREVLAGLPRDGNGLLPGEENPADDPASLPYLLSSQLLLAYTLRRLAQYDAELGLIELGLRADADRLLTATRMAFARPGPYGLQFAYETDGDSRYRLYHDANDVPTALAPLWGLVPSDDPLWRNFLRFAWFAGNRGYVPGRHGGLGSRHTAGVWPLGDAQEWIVATLIGDRPRARSVERRLRLVASDDGMLPETYDPADGRWLARHWFAWPGALVGLAHRTITNQVGPWTGALTI